MKNLFKNTAAQIVIMLIMTILFANNVHSKDVKITYLQHDAFIIQADNKTFYFDITSKPNDSLPSPDVIFITHNHADHFGKLSVINLAKKSGAKVVAPEPVITSLTGFVADTQLITYTPAQGTKITGNISGVSTTIYGSSDGTSQNSYRFEFPSGVTLFFNGDMPANVFEYLVTTQGCTELLNMDIAMLDDWAYTISDFNTNYKPDVIIKMHMWTAACVIYTDYPASFELNKGNIYNYTYSNSMDDNAEQNMKIQVFPNPSSTHTIIKFSNPDRNKHTLTLFNSNGQVIQNIQHIEGNEIKLENEVWLKGMYFFKLYDNNGITQKGKFIKE